MTEATSQRRAHEIQKKVLIVEHLAGMKTEKKVRMIGQPAQEIDIDGDLLAMFPNRLFNSRGGESTGIFVQLPPIFVNGEYGKCGIDARLGQQLCPIGGLGLPGKDRPTQETDKNSQRE